MARLAWLRSFVVAALLAGCAQPQPAPVASTPPPPPPAPVAFDQAVLNAGNAVFTAVSAAGGRQTIVIDPLVDGVTGQQNASTRALGVRLAELARQKYPQLDVQPFTADTVAKSPIVMVGTFTPVNAQNQPTGTREAYRFCLVMADLKSGKTVAKSVARALPDGIDPTPVKVFADSPAWTDDASVKGYINTCQATKVGDAIPAVYVNGIITAAIINQAMDAYDDARYREALDLYTNARSTPSGAQLRVFNGLYLTHTKLGQREQATAAFGDLVDYGLHNDRLAVKLLFRPASTAFVADAQGASYDMWLREIADRAARSTTCLEVVGHSSASGSPVLNERLSVLRAEYVKGKLEQDAAALKGRVVASGQGSKQVLIGTGADNASDALDRRIEFKVVQSCV